ncbi:MAG: hypothetical protein ACRCSI_13435 [Eubacterium aggregans]
MATIPVKWFDSTMPGAPQLGVNWGDTVNMLDAVLVNGFNSKNISSMTRVGNLVTVVTSTAHGYVAEQVLQIAGATETDYNGDIRVKTILSTTSFTFELDAGVVPATPATGALITVKVAPLGFEIAFTGTNKRAYRSSDLTSTRNFLRVDNSVDPNGNAAWCPFSKVTMAQSMTDIDTFVGARAPFNPSFPTRNEGSSGSGASALVGWYKWYQRNTINVPSQLAQTPAAGNSWWMIIGDGKSFYFSINAFSTTTIDNEGPSFYAFGDINSFKQGDAFGTLLVASDSYNALNGVHYPSGGPGETGWFSDEPDGGKLLLRDYTQLGNPTRFLLPTVQLAGNSVQQSGMIATIPFPNGPDFSMWMAPLWIKEEARGDIRGTMPGMYFLPQLQPYANLTKVENISGYPGKKVIMLDVARGTGTSKPRFAIDYIGPWR